MTAPVSDPLTPRAQRLALGLLLAATLAVYSALSGAGFVFDDVPLVVHNGYTEDLSRVVELFQVDLWRTSRTASVDSGYYRPLMLLSLAVDRALWGLSPAGHHAQSLLWHVLACAALGSLLWRLLPPCGALLGLTLFALHPAQSEAVAWIAARNDLMVACFTFLALRALLDASPSPRALALGGLAGLAAALSKESGVLAIGLLGVLDLARWGRPRGWPRYAVLLAGILAWAALRASVGVRSASLPDAAALGFLVERGPQWIAHYARLLVWPSPLSVGASLEYLEVPGWAAALACLGSAAGVGLMLWRGGRLAAAGLAIAASSFGPSLLAIALRGQLGERYLYMPMGGLALALGAALPARRGSLLAALPVVLAWVGVHRTRLPEWRDDLSLQSAAVRDTPSPYTYASLAHILHGEGRLPEAAALYHLALQGERPSHDACAYAVLVPLKMNQLDLAAEGLALATQARCPKDAKLAGLSAMVHARQGDWPAVREDVELALRLDEPLSTRAVIAGAALARTDDDSALFAEVFASWTGDLAALEAVIAPLIAEPAE